MKVKIVKAKVEKQKVNCCLESGFLEISICTDKLFKKIGDKISKKLTSKEKDSKFIREKTTAPLGLAIIPITFTSNVINNNYLSNYESITILTKVLIEKYNSKMSNYILLDAFNSITLDSNSDSSSTSSSEIEAIHKTKGIRKCPILKRKVKRKVNYQDL
ncbi:14056_t:CDS:2 [Ambispora leptoticha]|uniref:14056_t:CDS:1 n=1 Tax=Ambispora leptoticha TaxID=144679 RepID=A0A9N9A9M3_9GLOM|nr:14056_t:CDS:2 [Ambispora leptoticha]